MRSPVGISVKLLSLLDCERALINTFCLNMLDSGVRGARIKNCATSEWRSCEQQAFDTCTERAIFGSTIMRPHSPNTVFSGLGHVT